MAHYLAQRAHWLLRPVIEEVRRAGLIRPFNLSIANFQDDSLIFTIRSSAANRKTRTTMFVLDLESQASHGCLDLSEENRKYGVERTNDAKLFNFAGSVYATFNTGHPPNRTAENTVFVQPVFPDFGPPKPVDIADRRRVEKNIMFEDLGGTLYSTYEWNDAPSEVVMLSDRWAIRQAKSVVRTANRHRRRYGQGTPWVAWDDTRVAVVHEKRTFGPLRSYVGMLASRTSSGDVSLGRPMVHSRFSRVGPLRRRNPRLLHCTYFAGLAVIKGSLVVSYGVNDQGFGMAELGSLS